jgi:hypothetical protein
MSVHLIISRPGREMEFVYMCGMREGSEFVAEIARKHLFRIFSGVFPAFMFEPADVDQAIRELCVLRDEMERRNETNPQLRQEQRVWSRQRWERLLARMEQLKSEPDAKAYFS